MRYEVQFIGSGYEVVKSVSVEAENMGEAIEKAETMFDGHYCEIEIPKWCAYNE